MKKYLILVVLLGILMMAFAANVASAGTQLPWVVQVLVSSGDQDKTLWLTSDSALNEVQSIGEGDSAIAYAYDLGPELGMINSLSIATDDPLINLAFAVTTGSSAVTYTITSMIVGVNLNNPLAAADAGITLTAGSALNPITGTIAGLYPVSSPSNKIYEARYNTAGPSVLADLVNGFSVTGGTQIANASTGIIPISGFVYDMQSEFKFTLTANTSASGTSHYDIEENPVPEMSSVMLALTGGLPVLAGFGLRRKRK